MGMKKVKNNTFSHLLLGSGSSSVPALRFIAATNLGLFRGSGATGLGIAVAGAMAYDFQSARLGMQSATSHIEFQDTRLGRGGAVDIIQIGLNAAAPAAQTFKGPNSSATDGAGGRVNIDPGGSTGTAVPALLSLRGTIPTTSGTTVQTFIDREIHGVYKALTNNTVTALINCTLASNTVAAGIIHYAVQVFDGTDLQVEEGVISFHVTNKGGAIANNTVVKFGNQQAATSGTLAVTWTITAASPAVVSVNANSSLTPSAGYPRLTYSVKNLTQQAIAIQ